MSLVGLNPERTRDLSATFRSAAQEADRLSSDTRGALTLAGLESTAPIELLDTEAELDRVGLVLVVRADVAEGFVIDPTRLTGELGLTTKQAEAVISSLAELEGGATSETPLLDIVLPAGTSGELGLDEMGLAELAELVGLPLAVVDLQVKLLAANGITDREEVLKSLSGADALRFESVADLLAVRDVTLSAEDIALLDAVLLPVFLNGETLDPKELTSEEQAALRALARVLGGADVKLEVRETYYSQNDKEDRHRDVIVGLDDPLAPINRTLAFVTDGLTESVAVAAADRVELQHLQRIASGELSVREASESTGLSEAEFIRAVTLMEEARFRRTGERVDLGVIRAFADSGDTGGGAAIGGDDAVIRAASTDSGQSLQPGEDLTSLSDDELSSELDGIAEDIVDRAESLDDARVDRTITVGTLSSLSMAASFGGPFGVGASIGLSGAAMYADYAARNDIEQLEQEVRDLREREDEFRQQQLDNALASDDIADFDINTDDVADIEGQITDIEAQIAELDAARADKVDAGFLASSTGSVQSGLFDTARLAAKDIGRVAMGRISMLTSFAGFGGMFGLDHLDATRKKELDSLIEKREALRREQLREVGDPAGVFTEEEAVVEMADAEYELSKEIAEAEAKRDEARQQHEAAEAEREKAEAAARAEQKRKEEEQRQRDRSEPNGGQVAGADPGVGHNDVPDSF